MQQCPTLLVWYKSFQLPLHSCLFSPSSPLTPVAHYSTFPTIHSLVPSFLLPIHSVIMKGFLGLCLAISAVVAHPTAKDKRFTAESESTSTVGASDISILQYALTLEHLENAFYREGLANFTQATFTANGFDADFHANFQRVALDEADHVKFLTTALQAAGELRPKNALTNSLTRT